ncbi:hypothetical protein PSU4_18020 [Pseudonocardia sulfidoxydans NBRC 16205]|uniref:Uncharacterized protein n=1 Tax=Pseudonocardia sulfidoxydans NBRC 16205 TaxID=1223511 RepID=A0A511DIL0_9PSEU|nr:hypothetical protein PSU4_18020 [Pseudonocardia sulfidoxydans NBRC 16205]
MAVCRVRDDGGVTVVVGAAHRHPRGAEDAEQLRVGVPVAVAGPDRDQHDPRRHCGEELPQAVARAVVGHLEDVGAQRDAGGEQVGLCGDLDVAGEQHRTRPGLGPDHERPVVDGGAVVGIDVGGRVDGPEHVEHQPGPGQPLPGAQRHDARPRLPRLHAEAAQRCAGLTRGADRDPADGPAPQRARHPSDVVGVQVADDHEVERVHTQPGETGVDGPVVRAGVDEHRMAGCAGRQDERIALPDVARDDRPSDGRPAGGDDARRHQHEQHTDQHGDEQRPQPPRPDQHREHHDHDDEQQRADPSRRPRHDPALHGRGPVGDEDEPPDLGPRQPHAHLGGGRTHDRQQRGQDPEHRRGWDDGCREQVGHQ